MCLECRQRAAEILADRLAQRPLRAPTDPARLEWESKVLTALSSILDQTVAMHGNPGGVAEAMEAVAGTMAMLDADDIARLRELLEGMLSRLTAVSQSVLAMLTVMAAKGDLRAVVLITPEPQRKTVADRELAAVQSAISGAAADPRFS